MNLRTLKREIRKGEDILLARAERASAAADKASLSLWRNILGILRTDTDNRSSTTWLHTYHKVLIAFHAYPQELAQVGVAIEKAVLAAAKIEPLVKDVHLLPAFSQTDLRRAVYSGDWRARLATQTKLAAPESIAATIASGVQQGIHPYKLAAQVKPLVQDVGTTARRIARHETIRAAHDLQLQQWESIGPELVIGYQVHAIIDERTRPEHRHRNGFEYFRSPTGEQRGFDKMPRPPHEADGSVAFNCRCYLTPILSEYRPD